MTYLHTAKFIIRSAVLFVLAGIAQSCENKDIMDVLEAESKDLSLGGIVNVERNLNGTVKLTFRGIVGAQSYELYEESSPNAGVTPSDGSAANSAGAVSTKGSARLLTVVQHAPGKLVYDF